MFAQTSEKHERRRGNFRNCYDVETLGSQLSWLPNCYKTEQNRELYHAVNAGVLGGSDLEAVSNFASESLRTYFTVVNHQGWLNMDYGSKMNASFILEQFMFGAYAMHNNIPLEFVSDWFSRVDLMTNENTSGYTHLLGEAKSNPDNRLLVAAKVKELNL